MSRNFSPAKGPALSSGSKQPSVSSRIRNLQQTIGSVSSGVTETSESDVDYAEVNKNRSNRDIAPKPVMNRTACKDQSRKWPPPKPDVPSKGIGAGHVNTNDAGTNVKKDKASLTGESSPLVSQQNTRNNGQINTSLVEVSTESKGIDKDRHDILKKGISKKLGGAPVPPPKANRPVVALVTNPTKDQNSDDCNASKMLEPSTKKTLRNKMSGTPPLLPSKLGKIKVAHSGSSDSECSDDGTTCNVRLKTDITKTVNTPSPPTPSRSNRPKLKYLSEGSSKTASGNTQEKAPTLITNAAIGSPPLILPSKLNRMKLSHTSSSASDSSESSRGDEHSKPNCNDTNPQKPHTHVVKMKTPPPMPPPKMNRKLIMNAAASKHGDDDCVDGEIEQEPTESNPPPKLRPVLPSKTNRPRLPRQSESTSDPESSLAESRSPLDHLGIEGGHATPVSPLAKSKLLFSSVDNLDTLERGHINAEDKASAFETNKLTTEASPKRRSLNLQVVKPLAILKKYLRSTESEKVADKADAYKDRGNDVNKRRSMGEGFRANLANISNLFKSKKADPEDSSKTTRLSKEMISTPGDVESTDIQVTAGLKNLRSTQSVPLFSHHMSANDVTQGRRGSPQSGRPPSCICDAGVADVEQRSSTYENMMMPSVRHDTGDGDDDNDDILDDDEEWDDVYDDGEFSDDEDDRQVQSLKERALSYDSYNDEYYSLLLERKKQVVEELVSTETSYVNRLYMLNKTAWEMSGANIALEMFHPSKVHHMFPSIEALYRLHGENILPAMKTTLEDWPAKPEIYPMWKKYLPFLTMYKSYTSQYGGALDNITQYKKSSPEFSVILHKLEEKSEFGKLALEHHLIEPIQRIARYKMLLQNYTKLLLDDEEEKSQMTDIIHSIDQLLNDCQNQLRKMDTFGDLYKLQEKFEDTLSLLSPTAHLLKEGPAAQIMGQNHKKKIERHIFLFSDSVLICTKRPSGKFRIIQQMELRELKVRPVDVACAIVYRTEKTMMLRDVENSVTILFKDDEIKAAWEEALLDAITVKLMQGQLRKCGSTDVCLDKPQEDSTEHHISFKDTHDDNNDDFSKVAAWIDDVTVTSCMSCYNKFISVLRKKHHCRGCGSVICSSCSRQKMALPCMNGEICRVCDLCFIRARRNCSHLTRRISNIALPRPKSRLTVKSRDNSVHQSNLSTNFVSGISWLRDVDISDSVT